jgi:protein O-GlcNAc transferase
MIASHSDASATALRKAFELARQGKLGDAEVICREILRHQADHSEALLLRGIIEVQSGRTAEAAESIRRCIRKDPTRAAAHALLGDTLSSLSRPLEALESYQTALHLDSSLVSAHHGRGNVLLDLERPREALSSYDRVLQSRANDSEALFSRGNALFRLNELDAAVESYARAVAVRPNYAAAHANRGAVLVLLRRPETGLASIEAALAIQPDFPDALYQRACALRALRKMQAALDAFDRALQARPEHLETLVGRGDVLRSLKRPADALVDFNLALQLRPDCVAALRGRGDALLEFGRPVEALRDHDAALQLALQFGQELADTFNSRGNSLRALRRFFEAVASYDESLRLDPDNPTVHYNRGTAFLRWGYREEQALADYCQVLQLAPDFAYVAGSVFDLQRNRGDWSVIAPPASRESIIKSVLADEPVIAPFAFLSVTDSAAAQRRCAARFAADYCATAGPARNDSRFGHKRIRLAYVSADLREHAVTYLMVGVMERHDRERFETVGISLRPAEASVPGERVKNAFDRFIDVSTRSDQEVADLMREMEIDIAVDLGGFTAGFRTPIFNLRAAPVQVNYLGYPGTMGAPFMDYLIADEFVIPAHRQEHYGERVVYLPNCFQANDDQRAIGDSMTSREQHGLPTGFVFCCLNNSHKINPSMFDIWMRLLSRVPGSVLWLLGEDSAVRANFCREARSRGVAAERLIFAARAPYAEHLNRLKLADLFLDTLPFNAGATASDVLWAGLPLLTCAGECFAARMSGSLLRAIDLPELITFDLEHYENRAVELALHPGALQVLRSRLAQNRRRCPLFDTDGFRRHLESAYTEMWLRNESGLEPIGFSVSGAAARSVNRISGPTNDA